MSDAASSTLYELTCPHCRKPFAAELLGEDARRRGFKCPHCRLFVPFERANGDDGAASTGGALDTPH